MTLKVDPERNVVLTLPAKKRNKKLLLVFISFSQQRISVRVKRKKFDYIINIIHKSVSCDIHTYEKK